MDALKHIGAHAQSVFIVEGGQERQSKAFIEPVSVKDPERQAEPAAAGLEDRRRYFFVMPADAAISAGDTEILWNGGSFEVLRCESFFGHTEGIMAPKAGGGNA